MLLILSLFRVEGLIQWIYGTLLKKLNQVDMGEASGRSNGTPLETNKRTWLGNIVWQVEGLTCGRSSQVGMDTINLQYYDTIIEILAQPYFTLFLLHILIKIEKSVLQYHFQPFSSLYVSAKLVWFALMKTCLT